MAVEVTELPQEAQPQPRPMVFSPVAEQAEAKVNPYLIVVFMMILTLIIMAAAIFKYIDSVFFGLAIGVWFNIPGIPGMTKK